MSSSFEDIECDSFAGSWSTVPPTVPPTLTQYGGKPYSISQTSLPPERISTRKKHTPDRFTEVGQSSGEKQNKKRTSKQKTLKKKKISLNTTATYSNDKPAAKLNQEGQQAAQPKEKVHDQDNKTESQSEKTKANKNVRSVYNIVNRVLGGIGGSGSNGPIYGEITMGSMQKIVDLMKKCTGFDASSRFIDVGSGIGKPNFHVTQDPGVAFSYGIEIEETRFLLCLSVLKGVLDAAVEQQQARVDEKDAMIQPRCIFEEGNITKANTFDPFTHVYMFSTGFPPMLCDDLAGIWNRSSSPYLICYHKPRDIIHRYGFKVQLLDQMSTSMHGSNTTHTAYIYQRQPLTQQAVAETSRDAHPLPCCDPLFVEPWKKVREGLHALKEDTDARLQKKRAPGPCTRSSTNKKNKQDVTANEPVPQKPKQKRPAAALVQAKIFGASSPPLKDNYRCYCSVAMATENHIRHSISRGEWEYTYYNTQHPEAQFIVCSKCQKEANVLGSGKGLTHDNYCAKSRFYLVSSQEEKMIQQEEKRLKLMNKPISKKAPPHPKRANTLHAYYAPQTQEPVSMSVELHDFISSKTEEWFHEAQQNHYLLYKVRKTATERGLKAERDNWRWPIKTKDYDMYAFHCLLILICSGKTMDTQLLPVFDKLYTEHSELTPQKLIDMGIERLLHYLTPIGFQNIHAKHIMSMTTKLLSDHDGKVPSSYEQLRTLDGVGHKVACVIMKDVFGIDAGIAMDVHVHKIFYSLGWCSCKDYDKVKMCCKQAEYIFGKAQWGAMNQIYAGLGQILHDSAAAERLIELTGLYVPEALALIMELAKLYQRK